MIRTALALALCVLAQPGAAGAPERSQRPVARANAALPLAAAQEAAEVLSAARQRPHARPPSAQEISAAQTTDALSFASPVMSRRPWARPTKIEQDATAKRRARREGAVCGTADLQGEVVGQVPGRISGCGIADAVSLRAVSGVALSQPALVDCETARALKSWVDKGLKPAFRQRGPVVEMRVAAHYACRTRNNQPGARISEHGRGRAIDISAFTMKDGEVITVLGGWGQGTTLRPLSRAYKSACGRFGTTLGPGSDGYHRDHFHFDTARHRGGAYCR